MSDLFDLTGRVAVMTGASKGMGAEMARGLAQHGATVVISSRTQEDLDATAAKINEAVGVNRVHGVAANVAQTEELTALIEQTNEIAGTPTIVVGNAGANPYYGPTSGIPDEAYDRTLDVNVKSNLWLAQLTAPAMTEGGAIMFTSSIGAFKPSTMLGTYAMAKLAVLGLVRNMAAEFGPQGVRVNAICPGLVKTDFARALWEDPKAAAAATKQVPLGRLGEPEDFRGIAVFLASQAGRYVNGQALTVDGGSVMWT